MGDLNSAYPPYSLTVKAAGEHFGFHAATIYGMISSGKLRRGYHYVKIPRLRPPTKKELESDEGKTKGEPKEKILIIREAFIEWMRERDGGNHDER